MQAILGGALTGCLAFGASVPAAADLFRPCRVALVDAAADRVETADQIRVERLSARDMFANNAGRGLTVSSEAALRRTVSRPSSVPRRVERLWRLRIPRAVDPADLRVSHRLRGGASGRTPAFTHDEDAARTLAVTVVPIRPVAVCRNATHQIVEGGVDLVFNLQQLPASGRYDVDIETSVDLP